MKNLDKKLTWRQFRRITKQCRECGGDTILKNWTCATYERSGGFTRPAAVEFMNELYCPDVDEW